jgi:hypothetical protein
MDTASESRMIIGPAIALTLLSPPVAVNGPHGSSTRAYLHFSSPSRDQLVSLKKIKLCCLDSVSAHGFTQSHPNGTRGSTWIATRLRSD